MVSVAIVISLRWSLVECCIVLIVSAVVVCSVNCLYFDFIDLELVLSLRTLDVEELNIFEVISQLVQSFSNPFILHSFWWWQRFLSRILISSWTLDQVHFDWLSGHFLFSAFCLIEDVVAEVTLFRFSESFSWREIFCHTYGLVAAFVKIRGSRLIPSCLTF